MKAEKEPERHSPCSHLLTEDDILWASARRSTRAIYGHMSYKDCGVFAKDFASEKSISRYIDGTEKIGITTDEIGFPEKIFGAVIKRRVNKEGKDGHYYLISISPKLRNPVRRVFTIGHELGHILLHGRLLETDMGSSKHSDPWFSYGAKIRNSMEMEANIFALSCLLPDKIIELAAELEKNSLRRRVKFCKRAIEKNYGSKISTDMILARIAIYEFVFEDRNCNDHTDTRYSGIKRTSEGRSRIISWLSHGFTVERKIMKSNSKSQDNTRDSFNLESYKSSKVQYRNNSFDQ